MYFNSIRSNARGVAILVKESCQITNVSAQIIVPGNLTKLSLTYKEENWTIAALYLPNNKDLNFFHTLFEAEHGPNNNHTHYAGDWNISLSQQMDTHAYIHENNTQNIDLVRQKHRIYRIH